MFINLIFLESILEALTKMTEKTENIEMLKLFFGAGVTPEFAENPKDADALKGGLGLFCLCFFCHI